MRFYCGAVSIGIRASQRGDQHILKDVFENFGQKSNLGSKIWSSENFDFWPELQGIV